MELPSKPDERLELDLLIRGFQVSRMLRLAADLEIADKIDLGATKSVTDLAAECQVQAQPLARVLRLLASFKVFSMTPDCSIGHTPRSELLRKSTERSLHYSARFWAGPGSWTAWNMVDVALHGANPHEAAWAADRFDYLRTHPDEARAFDEMMANFPDNRHLAVAQAYDFTKLRIIADIGGNTGETLRHVLLANPSSRGVLFDRPDVIQELGAEKLLHGRIDAVGGSFFEQIPGGADVYMLIRVLHDWSDEDCVRILRSCRAAMSEGARILIGDQILEPDPSTGNPLGYLVDTQMMAMFGRARERTENEFKELLDATGFSLHRIIPTSSPISLIEGFAKQ